MADAHESVVWSPRLGEHLQAARTRANLRRVDLARQLRVSEETIRLWEKGAVQPSPERLARLVALLSLETVDWPLRSSGPSDDLPELAKRLWAERDARGLTQAAVAAELGVSQAAYAGWETARSTPSDENLGAVARFLSADVAEIAELSASPFVVDAAEWPPLGQVMGRRRQELRLTRGQLAKAVGVSQHAIVAWELGSRVPGPRQFPRLAEALEMDAADLVAALPEMGVLSALGQLIANRQRELGLRSADVARLAGTTEATVSRWVNGRSVPVPENLGRLADALKLPYSRVAAAAGLA